VVAHRDSGDAGADLLYDSRAFVAGDHRKTSVEISVGDV
jgi:hypothetical protein